MFNTHGLIAVLILASINAKTAVTENDFSPGLRKPPSYENYILAQNYLKSIIDDQARRRFQQERHQQHFSYPNVDEREMTGPAFTFKLPMQPFGNVDEIPFAFGPSHPKFYEKNPTPTDNVLTYRKALSTDSDLVHFNSDGVSSHVVKAPMNVNPKINPFENENDESSNKMSKSNDVITREDWNKLVETLERKGQGKTIVNALQPFTQTRNDVAKKPVDLNSAWVIAVIAGVSAAFTVGLLAIGIGWYTLQKKAKAAADVDYPAYGITGPNKDVSPSSTDRRLAQSAQMYHYQHQKNQIIAMENQSALEQNGSISDIETDEENEEGDYTVYECPGLAPTGEMEVKNPLFLDDPTPVKKGTMVKPQPQQQQGQHKQHNRPQQANDNPKTSEK